MFFFYSCTYPYVKHWKLACFILGRKMSVRGGNTVLSFEEHAPDHVRINTVRFMKTKMINIVRLLIYMRVRIFRFFRKGFHLVTRLQVIVSVMDHIVDLLQKRSKGKCWHVPVLVQWILSKHLPGIGNCGQREREMGPW